MALTNSLEAPLRRFGESAWKWTLGFGLVAVALGVVILVWPDTTTRVVGVLFGIYLIVSAFAALALGLVAPMPVLARMLALLAAVAFGILGVLCFRSELQSLWLLALVLGIGWIAGGLAEIFRGLFFGWTYAGWSVLGGIVLVVAGIVLLVYPIHSITVLVVVVGIVLIVDGIADVIGAFALRGAMKEVLAKISTWNDKLAGLGFD
ncbi:HdeD family acid-resistance protein [Nocardia stercoris]|nr:DUF308 domain-containing protein [Nocardia stercoris]